MDGFWQMVNEHICAVTEQGFHGTPSSAGGGCINRCYRLRDQSLGRSFFVKRNRSELLRMFETEADGLRAIQKTGTIAVPRPICHGRAGPDAYLALEWLDLGGRGSGNWAEMGRALARLHQTEQGNRFGWGSDNYIGATPQINGWSPRWPDFFAHERLGYQVKLARERGLRLNGFEALVDVLPVILDQETRPSLVHGDLWSGNAGFTAAGQPVIYDAAVYLGDREVDLAMTELFGGFPRGFYRGYEEVFPLRPGYERRRTAYNLYHVLNHFNLFGGGYGGQAERMIEDLLRR